MVKQTGTTALMYAVEMEHLNSIQLLLDHGANLALVDYVSTSNEVVVSCLANHVCICVCSMGGQPATWPWPRMSMYSTSSS